MISCLSQLGLWVDGEDERRKMGWGCEDEKSGKRKVIRPGDWFYG